MKNKENNLRKALKANAIFSFGSGLGLILFSKRLAELMGIGQPNILLIVGIGLMVFCCFLVYNAFKNELSLKLIRLVIFQDWIWVVGSVILLVVKPFEISWQGNLLIAFVAIIVMVLALLQTKYLPMPALKAGLLKKV